MGGVVACKHTTTINTVSVCPRCGTINKSGERSCCGRGGSWFKKCGGAGNTKLHHTWHEGIQVCKARPQYNPVIDQQLYVAQRKGIGSSQGIGMINYKTSLVGSNKTFAFTSVNTSTPMSDAMSIVTTAYTSDSVSILSFVCYCILV